MTNKFKKLFVMAMFILASITAAFAQGDPVTYRTRSGDGFMQVDHYISAARRLGIPTGATETLDADPALIKTNQVFLFYNTTLGKLRIYDKTSNTWKDASTFDVPALGDGNFLVGNSTGGNTKRKITAADIQTFLDTRVGIGSANGGMTGTSENFDMNQAATATNFYTWTSPTSAGRPTDASAGNGGFFQNYGLTSGASVHSFKLFSQPIVGDAFWFKGRTNGQDNPWYRVASREWALAQPWGAITSGNISNWNTAYNYGQGIPTNPTKGIAVQGSGVVDINTLPQTTYATAISGGSTNPPTGLTSANMGGYLQIQSGGVGFSLLSDRSSGWLGFRSQGIDNNYGTWRKIWHDGNLTQASIDNWNSAFSWGNHANKYVTLTGDDVVSGVKTFTTPTDIKYGQSSSSQTYHKIQNAASALNSSATASTSLMINVNNPLTAIMTDFDIEINRYELSTTAPTSSRSGRVRLTFYNSTAGGTIASTSAQVLQGDNTMLTNVDYYRDASNNIVIVLTGDFRGYAKANVSLTMHHALTDAVATSIAKGLTLAWSNTITGLTKISGINKDGIIYTNDSRNLGQYAVVSDPTLSAYPLVKVLDMNAQLTGNYLYPFALGSTNSPEGTGAGTKQWSTLSMSGGSAGIGAQFAIASGGTNYTTDPIWFRERNTLPWKKIWSTGDFGATNVTNWNSAYSWGNYAAHGLGTGLQGNAAYTGDLFSNSSTGFFRYSTAAANKPSSQNGTYINMYRASNYSHLLAIDDNAKLFFGNKTITGTTWSQLSPIDSTALIQMGIGYGYVARNVAGFKPEWRNRPGENAWDLSMIEVIGGSNDPTGKAYGSTGKASLTSGLNNFNSGRAAFVAGRKNSGQSDFSIVGGEDNTIDASAASTFSIGANNKALSGGSKSIISGDNNTLGAWRSIITGTTNELNSGSFNSIVGGKNNTLTMGSENSITVGDGNIATNGAWNSIVGGKTNTLTNGSVNNIISGTSNRSEDDSGGTVSSNSIISGNVNTGKGSVNSLIVGNGNVIRKSESNIIAGGSNKVENNENTTISSNNIIGGYNNDIGATSLSNIIGGGTNAIYNSSGSIISGTNNQTSGAVNIIINGDTNVANTGSNSSLITGISNISNNPAQIITGIYNENIPHNEGGDINTNRMLVVGGGSNPTTDRKDVFYVRYDGTTVSRGDVIVKDPTKGVVVTSPDGSFWRMTVDNNGIISTTKVTYTITP